MLALALGAMVMVGSGGLPAEPRPEREQVEAATPALAGPVALTATGGGLFLGGLGLLVGSGLAFPSHPGSLPNLDGVPFAIAGLACLVVGLVLGLVAGERLVEAVNQRTRLDARSEGLRQRLKAPAPLPADAPARDRPLVLVPLP